MTTTNRAFIKAYRHDAPQSAPAAPTAWSQLRQTEPVIAADALCSSVEYVSVAAGRGAGVIDAFSTSALPGVAQGVATRSASIAIASGNDSRQPLSGQAMLPRTTPPRRLDRSSTDKRPLSSFAPLPAARSSESPAVRSRSASSAPPSGAGFQPGTTIASFRWPSLCRALWQECGSDLQRVGKEIVAASHDGPSLVGVIGLFPGLGCTTTLLTLAGPLAARGGRLVVVDANFRTPKLGSLLGVEADITWQDVLARGAPVGDAVVRAIDDNLDLLPFQPHPANHDMPPRSIGLHASVTAGVLRYAYDVALVDLGAFFTPETQPMLLELVRSMRLDRAIAVAGPEAADPRDLDTLGEHLGESGCQLLGTIENRAA